MTAKVLLRTFKQLNFSKIMRIFKVFLRNPLFCILYFYASLKTFGIAKKYFPKTSSSSGIGNAFRHALWTCLILSYCCKISSPEKSLKFCRKITDFHEELFPNPEPEKLMDLHNNEVGIQLFTDMLPGIHRQFFENSFFIEKILEKTKTAEILSEKSLHNYEILIYLN